MAPSRQMPNRGIQVTAFTGMSLRSRVTGSFLHLFSTDSVDKSVSNLFNPGLSPVVGGHVTDWLKNNQTQNIYI
jgi:hypothetical protein